MVAIKEVGKLFLVEVDQAIEHECVSIVHAAYVLFSLHILFDFFWQILDVVDSRDIFFLWIRRALIVLAVMVVVYLLLLVTLVVLFHHIFLYLHCLYL
jgi:hypothetical protein